MFASAQKLLGFFAIVRQATKNKGSSNSRVVFVAFNDKREGNFREVLNLKLIIRFNGS